MNVTWLPTTGTTMTADRTPFLGNWKVASGSLPGEAIRTLPRLVASRVVMSTSADVASPGTPASPTTRASPGWRGPCADDS